MKQENHKQQSPPDAPLEDRPPAKKATITLTLVSQMMGAQLLSMPYIFSRLGAALSVVSFVVCYGFVVYLLSNYTEVIHYTQAQTYRQAVKILYGRHISLLLDACLILSNYGFCTGYIIIASNSVVNFVQNTFNIAFYKIATKAVIAFAVIFPLTLLRTITALSKISSFSGVIIFVVTISFIVEAVLSSKRPNLCGPLEKRMNIWPSGTVSSAVLTFMMYIPNIQSVFSVYNAVPSFLRELHGPPVLKKKTIKISLYISTIGGLLIVMTVGFSGVIIFGDTVKNNVLVSISSCKMLYFDILGLFYAFVVIMAFSLVIFPIKQSIMQLCDSDWESRKSHWIQIAVSFTFVVLSFALASVFEEIVVIFGIFASLSGFVYVFLLPVLLSMRLPQLRRENKHLDEMEEGMEVDADPVIVPLISQQFNISIQQARKLSMVIFGQVRTSQEISVGENGTVAVYTGLRPHISFLRRQTISFRRTSHGPAYTSTNSKLSMAVMQAAREAAAEDDHENLKIDLVDNEIQLSQHENAKMSNSTIAIGSFGIAFSTMFCGVGLVMNIWQTVKRFL